MKPLKTTYLALMTLILASCEIVLPSVPFSSTQDPTSNDTTSTTTTSETQSSIGDSSTTSLPSSSATNSSSQVQELGYAKQTNPSITLDSYRQSSGNFGLPSTGDVKLLVIPVTFTDYRCGNLCVTRTPLSLIMKHLVMAI